MKKSTLNLIFIAAALILVFGYSQLSQIGSRIGNLENQVNNLRMAVDNQNWQMNSLKTELANMLKEQASILDSCTLSYGTLNTGDMTIGVTLTATPKEYTEDTAAVFTLGGITAPMSRSGPSFSASLTISATQEYEGRVTFTDGKTSRSESIGEPVSFKADSLYQIKCGYSGEWTYKDDQLQYDGSVFAYFHSPAGNQVTSARLVALLNDSEVWSAPIAEDRLQAGVQDGLEQEIKLNQSFPVNPGDKFILQVEFTDSLGLVYVHPVSSTAVSEDGKKLAESIIPEDCTVYDKSGKKLTFQ